MATNKTKWTPEMLDRFHELRARNYTVLEIAEDMGLRFEVVKSRISNEQNAAKKKQRASFKLDPAPDPEPKADPAPAPDMVNHPSHYTAGGIECINAIRAATTGLDGFQSYLSGTIIKYIWRWKWKNGLEDLKKAEKYLHWLISEVEQDG